MCSVCRHCPNGKGGQTVTTKVNGHLWLQSNDLTTAEHSPTKKCYSPGFPLYVNKWVSGEILTELELIMRDQ